MTDDWSAKFEEVGIAWKKERSISIIAKSDIYENDRLLMLENRKKETEKQPDFKLYRERIKKIVTEE